MSRRAARLARRWGDPAQTIHNAELLYPVTALAIAVLETGHFRARSMMRSHNWFGFVQNNRGFQINSMKRGKHSQNPKQGKYTGADRMMADYQAWEEDVCLKYSLHNEAAFRRWIVRHYAEDPRYEQKLAITLAEVEKTWQ